MIRNLILDWSGTLVDDLDAVLEATNAVLRAHGGPTLSRDGFRARFRLPYAHFYDELIPGADPGALDELYHRHFDPIQDRVRALPGASEFLDFCRETGRRVAILSSVQEAHFQVQLGRMGWGDRIDAAYAGARDKRGRISDLLRERDFVPGQTWFVGDMIHDIDAARAGGVGAIGVLTGYDSLEKLLGARPDAIAPDLGGVARLLGTGAIGGADFSRPVGTVGALILDGAGRCLMLRTHKWSGLWGIPGGKIRRGESSEEAMRREIREETGLELEDARFVMVQDCIDSPEFLHPAHFLLLNYVARAVPGEVRLNDEAQEHRWVRLEDALAMGLNRPTRRLILEVLAGGAARP